MNEPEDKPLAREEWCSLAINDNGFTRLKDIVEYYYDEVYLPSFEE